MDHMGARGPGRLSLAVVGLAVLAVGACSPSHGGASATSSPSSTTIPPPATSSANSSALPNPSDWPDQDTPISQASAQLQTVWDPYGVTLIPSRHVFDSMPAVPAVLNKTNGALSAAQAQQIGVAYYRTDALWGWADAHDQMKLQLYLSNQGFLNGPSGQAESAGEPVTDPSCDLYPVKLAVVPVDQSIVSFEAGVGDTVTSQYALVEQYSAPCSVTATTAEGPQVLESWQGPALILETGEARADPVLGLSWFAESARSCPSSGLPTLPSEFGTPPPASGATASPGPEACDVFG